jgi:hypothetical protein
LKLTGPTLIQDTNGCEIQGDPRLLINADPLLDGGLADNGGRAQGDTPTQNEQTIKLADGSPAIDAGDNGSCETTDENGVARPAGDNCDLGAVENTVAGGTTTGGDTTGGDTTGGTTTGGSSDSGGCSLIR